MPGHRIQIDVNFFHFTDVLTKQEVKRFQYMAIDDVIRARLLHIYDQHTQLNAIYFVDRVRKILPVQHSHHTD